ncbi:methyltransferase [Candidatus Pacearchaeota archaeon]|nr:methyltransferase [Candidatus Pacearchaeota archaeon]
MIIEYDDSIEKQKFSAFSKELEALGIEGTDKEGYYNLGEISHPTVALDRYKLSSLENGGLIKYLFTEAPFPVGTLYDGVNTYWFKYDGTWPATIDSLVHLRGQKQSESLSLADKVLDIGCGTGIAGNYAYKKNQNIKQIDFADINPNNVKTALMNTGTKTGIISNGFDNIKEKYDVILASAVPAMPVYPGLKREINPLFEGTAFLENILKNTSDHLNKNGKLILSHASMSENVFQDLAKKYGIKVKGLDNREIAFREEFLQDADWVKYLIELGGLRNEEKDGHKYWFDLKVRELSFE